MESAEHRGIWDEFIAVCRRAGVPDKALRWYVVRIERYLRSQGDTPPHRHSAKSVTDYVERAWRETHVPSWIFRQLIDALRLYFAETLTALC